MNLSSPTVVRHIARVSSVCLWAILIVSIALIVHYGLLSRPPLSWMLRDLSRFDLLLHMSAFAGLALPAFVLFRSMMKTGMVIFLLGAGLELAQWVTATREGSVSDLAANGLGIVLAAGVVAGLRRWRILPMQPVDAKAG